MRDYGSKHILFEECKCTDERWWNDVKSRGRSAILVTIPEAVKKQEFWIPFSQVHDDSEVYQKESDGDLIVSRWFAEKEGLV